MKHLKKLIEWLLFLGLFYFIGFSFATSGFFDSIKFHNITEKTLAIVGAVVIIHIVLAVHELGHLLTGLLQGFRFEMFVVGFFGVKKEGSKVKMYFNKNLSYYGGIAATVPIDISEHNAKKFAHIHIAGPLFSLWFAIAAILVSFMLEPICKFVLFIGSLASFGVFLATTIPSKTGLFYTDRKRYQRLIIPRKAREIELTMLRLTGLYSKHNSYKEVSFKDIELLISENDPLIKFYGLYNALCFQIEFDGTMDAKTQEEYKMVSQSISQNLVTIFDKEIEKQAKQVSNTNRN